MSRDENIIQSTVRSLFAARWLASLVLLIAIDLCTFFALTRTTGTATFTHQDKVLHALAFFILFILGYWVLNFDLRRRKTRFSVGLAVINTLVWLAYAVFIETAQYYLGYRSASLGDLIADAVGMTIGWLFLAAFRPFPRELKP